MANVFDWLLNNIDKATWGRWMPGAKAANEGGVDIALPGGTPIYALATGPLRGAGYFYHGGPYFSSQEYGAGANPGYGVVSQQVNVPGVGLEDLYYQHIDIAPGINLCQSGNCGNQVVQRGQLIGYSKGNVGEAEIGLGANTGWGGIWGAPSDPGTWLDNPVQALKTLAQGGGPSVTNTDCSQCNAWTTIVCDQLATNPTTQWSYGKFGIPDKVTCDKCLQCAQKAATNAIVPGASQWAQVAQNATKATDYLTSKDFWIRLGIGLAAIILVLWGLHAFVANTGPVKRAKQAGSDLMGQVPVVGQSAKDLAEPDNPAGQPQSNQQPHAQIQPLSGNNASSTEAAGAGESAEVAEVAAV